MCSPEFRLIMSTSEAAKRSKAKIRAFVSMTFCVAREIVMMVAVMTVQVMERLDLVVPFYINV